MKPSNKNESALTVLRALDQIHGHKMLDPMKNALMSMERSSYEALNFLLKPIEDKTHEDNKIERLRKSMNTFDEDSVQSLVFLLESLSKDGTEDTYYFLTKFLLNLSEDPREAYFFLLEGFARHHKSEVIRYLRKGLVNLNTNPKDAFNFFLLALTLESADDSSSVNHLRKGLLSLDSNPLDAFSFLLLSISETDDSSSINHLRKGLLSLDTNPTDAVVFLLKSCFEASADSEERMRLDNLRKAVVGLSENSEEWVVFLMKAFEINEDDTFGLLRKSLTLRKESEYDSVHFLLKAVSRSFIGQNLVKIMNIRKSYTSYNESPMESLTHLLTPLRDNFLYDDLVKTINRFPNTYWLDAFSRGQIKSKMWLLEEWQKLNLPIADLAYVLAGWYGVLPYVSSGLNHQLAKSWRSFDLDPSCAVVAESLNKSKVMENWGFKATTMDIHDLNYRNCSYKTLKSDGTSQEVMESPDVIINTSCEHIDNFTSWYDLLPEGVLLVLQSNDYFECDGHINCSKDLDSFISQAPMSQKLYSGELPLEKYTRFMIIGYK